MKDSNRLVSIIMPVKNTAPFLQACLDSIVKQQYTQWELIAVDDHSSDESRAILTQYSEQESRITVLGNTGQGIIPALRLAFTHCKGHYITRMDSDDKMPENKLFDMVEVLSAYGTGVVTTGKVKYFSEGSLGDGFMRYQNWLNHLMETNTVYTAIYKECVIPSPCWMMHTTDLKLIGSFEREVYPEDYDLCFRMYKELKCIPVQKVLHFWRDHALRVSRTHHHYKDNAFIALKVPYFLELEYKKECLLVLWGAGKKGKSIASILVEQNIPFQWVCNNEQKIGRAIYGVILSSIPDFKQQNENIQVIVAVASPEEQQSIASILKESEAIKPYFFC